MNFIDAEPEAVQKVLERGASKKIIRPKLDRAFNDFIRARDFDFSRGLGKCICCGGYVSWGSDWHAGHYWSKGANYDGIRWDEDNVHGQCKACNYYSGDAKIFYTRNLLKKIGQQRLDALDIKKRHMSGLTPFAMACMVVHYRREFQKLKKGK